MLLQVWVATPPDDRRTRIPSVAGTLIMIAPVILFFLLFQRHFIRGLTSGAVKG
jgi:ABC-type glycerol-3-phosphate transport system permease component